MSGPPVHAQDANRRDVGERSGPDQYRAGAASRTSFCASDMPKPDPLPCQSSFHLEASFPDDRPPFLERSRGAISCPRSTMCLRTDGSANLSPTAERAADEMLFGAHTVAWLRRVGFNRMRALLDSCAERLPCRSVLKLTAFLCAQSDDVFLDESLFPRHESPPELCRHRD
jgi:hypothetical protein